ncbi:MAG: hypothetical protein ACC658_10140 [Acidimicrobiia bacterium]
MCTPQVVLMDMDRGILARIDRRLLTGLGADEALRTVRVPATGAKWSTWKRYCDSVGVSMGRAVAMLIDRELLSVFGEHTAGEWPAFAQQATEKLENRETKIEAREHTGSIPTRRGCVKGVRSCDVGSMDSRPESNGPKRRQGASRALRRIAPRLDATNAAPADQD